jgi:hypothetical protein
MMGIAGAAHTVVPRSCELGRPWPFFLPEEMTISM